MNVATCINVVPKHAQVRGYLSMLVVFFQSVSFTFVGGGGPESSKVKILLHMWVL